MRMRSVIFVLFAAILLAACNFSLAEDIAPPPGYIAPTAAPIVGPVFPASAPSPAQGAAIYAEKCAACHGLSGLGDGPQGQQLSVRVPGLSVDEVARKAIPSDWFATVKQGRIQRFMPPFSGSLNDQQIWDVIAYAFSLNATPEEIVLGKQVYETNCLSCHGADGTTLPTSNFTGQEFMAKRTSNDLAQAIVAGTANMPAFTQLAEAEVYAAVAYVRALSFEQSVAVEVTPAATATEITSEATAAPESTQTTETVTTSESVATETTEAPATEEAVGILGAVSGTVTHGSGQALPEGLEIILHGFDHGEDPNAAPVEILTETATVNEDGTYSFADVDLGVGRFFYADTLFEGIPYQTEVAVSEEGVAELALGEMRIYTSTDDYSVLSLDQFHMFFDFSQEGFVSVFQVYTLGNTSDKALNIPFNPETQELPFIKLPENATEYIIEGADGPFMGTDIGVAMPPSEFQYELQIAFQLPYAKKVEMSQFIPLKMTSGLVIVPLGIKMDSEILVNGEEQDFGGEKFTVYNLNDIAANTELQFALSGKPKTASADDTKGTGVNNGLLIGIGSLGLVLIVAGLILYIRGRKQSDDEDDDLDEEDEGMESDDIMDAIITLDDQFRTKKISEEVYTQRREELKAQLKKNI